MQCSNKCRAASAVRLAPLRAKLFDGLAAPLAVLPNSGSVVSEAVSVGFVTTTGAATVIATGALRPTTDPHAEVA